VNILIKRKEKKNLCKMTGKKADNMGEVIAQSKNRRKSLY
jgi:hypothetical protein